MGGALDVPDGLAHAASNHAGSVFPTPVLHVGEAGLPQRREPARQILPSEAPEPQGAHPVAHLRRWAHEFDRQRDEPLRA
jgi:hypothetical protein